MNHLMYFFPGKHGVTDALLRECGLTQIVEGTESETREVIGGPGGQAGVSVVFRRADSESVRVAYDGETQHWEECAGGAYWVGYWRDAVPGPQDLARKVQIDGHMVELLDGNQWRIPLVRQWDGRTGLPCRIKLDPSGQEIQSVNPKHEPLYARVMSELERLTSGENYTLSNTDMMDIAAQSLCANYHMGKWEASALGLFDTQNLRLVFDALIDMDALRKMQDAQKKTQSASDTSSSCDGLEEICQDTRQLAQTS